MYLKYYHIEKKPFQLTVDPAFLWMSDKHKEALAVLTYGLLDNKGFIMLTGDVGIGKTTLVNAFINNLGPETLFANITNPGLKLKEFFNILGMTFNFGNKFSGKDEFLIAFKAFLEGCHRDGKRVLLIIDEAQRLSGDIMEEIRLLSNIELQSGKLLNIFFVGQDELEETLDRHENRALRQRMSMVYHLDQLSPRETSEYIQHRLRVAGCKKRIFTEKAIGEIYVFSEGYPRIINLICDHAMLKGFITRKKRIDEPEIIACARELRLKKKWVPESSREKRNPVVILKNDRVWFRKFRWVSKYLPHFAAALFIFIMACFLYFPLRAGASFSGILPYWKDQLLASGGTVTKRIPDQTSPQIVYKVIKKDAGTQGDSEAGKLEREKAIKAESAGAESIDRREAGMPGGGQATTGRLEDKKTDAIETESNAAASDLEPGSPAIHQSSGLTSRHPGASQQITIPDSEKRYIIAFEFDADDIAREGRERLIKTAALMKEHPEITLTISGHTDNTGEEAYNVMLSKYRAEIAKKFLVGKGIAPERITAVGKGSEEPIADNNSADGRRMNRRVEVVVNIPNEF